ncbi:metal-dependent amidohydrolase 3 [Nannochloropsis oceanica]
MLLLHNARLWQWDDDSAASSSSSSLSSSSGRLTQPEAGWCLIDTTKGIFDAVGCVADDDEEHAAYKAAQAKATRIIDMNMKCAEGSIILPGLIDAHIHVGYMGEAQEYLQLSGCRTLSELGAAVAAYGKMHPSKSWVVGVGWDQSAWGGDYPSRQDLDKAMGDDKRPVVLYRACWHIVVANTAALEVSGISLIPAKKPPAGIDIDAISGFPTGIFRENAVSSITDHIAEADDDVRETYFRNALNQCLRAGLTSVQTNDSNAWHLYRKLESQQKLPLRVFLTVNHDEFESNVNHSQPLHPSFASPSSLLSCERVKLYSDGSLGAETAALRSPYVGTTNTGMLIHTLEELREKIKSAHKAGFQLEVHAIGNRALETVLDALEGAEVPSGARPVITHCQVMGEDLMERMAWQGVVASIQPSFVSTDCKWVQARLPVEVQRVSYCWKSLGERGVMCAGGSDAPVEDCRPLGGIYDAMHRVPHAGKPRGGKEGWREEREVAFLPEECLSFSEALRLYTIGGAYACHAERKLGRIAPGYQADFVVIDRDVTGPRREEDCRHALLEAAVEQVWVGGVCRLDTKGENERKVFASAAILGGPFIPGKNGPLRGQGRKQPQQLEEEGMWVLQNKRLGAGCCGH